MEYFTEELDRETGDLRTVSQGHWVTVTELGEAYGLGRLKIRVVLARMSLLQSENNRNHGRYRLSPWAVEMGLGKRVERKKSVPFDVLSPKGQAWIAERWETTMTELEEEISIPARVAEEALAKFVAERNEFRKQIRGKEMSTEEKIYWLADHFDNLSQSEIASIVHVSQPRVSIFLNQRTAKRNQLLQVKRRRLPGNDTTEPRQEMSC